MAWWDDAWDGASDYFEDYYPSPDINEVLFGAEDVMDAYAQDLMWSAVVEKDEDALHTLIDYMWDQYNIDFVEEFDFDDFRDWIEGNTP